MKMWHVVILLIVAYFIGSKYGSIGQTLLGKVGL